MNGKKAEIFHLLWMTVINVYLFKKNCFKLWQASGHTSKMKNLTENVYDMCTLYCLKVSNLLLPTIICSN